MNESQKTSSFEATIEASEPIRDKAILSYFQNLHQLSLINIGRLKKNSYLINCKDDETRERILKENFFSISNCLLRSSLHGYQNDKYDLDVFKLIISNIDEDILDFYAKFLSPSNEPIDLTKLNYCDDTFVITFSKAYCRNEILLRYHERSEISHKKVKLLDCFMTNAVIIKPIDDVNKCSRSISVEIVKNKLVQQIKSLNISLMDF